MKLKRVFALLATLLMLPLTPALAYPGINQSPTYIFSETAVKITIPDCFKPEKVITLADGAGAVIEEAQDIFVTDDGRVFVLDSVGGRVLIYSPDLTLESVIDVFTLPDGSRTTLNKPMGLFVTPEYDLYIADTKNERILRMDLNGGIIAVTAKPESFQGTDFVTFHPMKLVVDSIGRVTVVAQGINMGLLQFDADGVFTGYMGAPKVKVNVVTKLWKRFSTAEQKAQMEQFVPTEYSNLAMDSDGFIYGTISSVSQTDAQKEFQDTGNSGTAAPVRKLNSMGTDILKRKGRHSPIGNLDLTEANSVSRMIDVALGPGDSYTLLDNQKKLLYTYSEDGVLLCVFGGTNKSKSGFERPVAIAYQGSRLLVLDSSLSQLMTFIPTDYYATVLAAIVAKHEGDYDLEYEKWAEVARLNSNFKYAYTGLGKVAYNGEDYDQAMEYFEYANDRKNYSMAKDKNRKEYMALAFPILFGSVGAIIAVWITVDAVKRVKRYFGGRKP